MTAAVPSRVSPRVVLASIVGMWLCYFALVTARGWIVGLEMHGPLLWRRLAVAAASMAVTIAIWPVLRSLDPRPLWFKIVAVLVLSLPASLLLAGINQWVFADIENEVVTKIGEREGFRIRQDEAGNLLVDPLSQASDPPDDSDDEAPPAPLPTATPHVPTIAQQEQDSSAIMISSAEREVTRWRQLTDVALGRYFLLLAWASLYLALAAAEQARSAERREGQYRRAAKAAELRSLRYQVNPHFLFNTLNSLSAMVMTGKTEAAETMIQTLSNFYRRSLTGDPTGDLSLDEEIGLQKLYLDIEAVRFPERLRSEWDIPPELAEAQLPGMILQPLIENSVKYAVAASRRAVTVSIAAREEFGRLVLSVTDNGPGQPSRGEQGHGIGLANVRDRLAARFGDAASLASGPGETKGWRTVVRLPLVRHG
ncbi:MAG TPA: histidine kinase [Novosphingobium sp.]|nr:histidine kinase [Novosphingobium sp.]